MKSDGLIKRFARSLKQAAREMRGKRLHFAVLSASNGGEWVTGGGLVVTGDFCLSEEDALERKADIAEYNKNAGSLFYEDFLYPEEMDEKYIHMWRDINCASGCGLADLFLKLDEGLSRGGILRSEKDILDFSGTPLPPIIILFYRGSTGDGDMDALNVLRQNIHFKRGAQRIAVAHDDGTDMNILNEFTGSAEMVFNAKDADVLQKLIEAVDFDMDYVREDNGVDEEDRGWD
jgi:hypothetical protein